MGKMTKQELFDELKAQDKAVQRAVLCRLTDLLDEESLVTALINCLTENQKRMIFERENENIVS